MAFLPKWVGLYIGSRTWLVYSFFFLFSELIGVVSFALQGWTCFASVECVW
jgi:hypothetical protein